MSPLPNLLKRLALASALLGPLPAAADRICKRIDSDGSLLVTNECGGPKGHTRREDSATRKKKIAQFEPFIADACRQYSIPPALVRAVIAAESDFTVEARSSKGALGLMQLMPATASDLDRRHWIEWLRQNRNPSEKETSDFIQAFVRGRAPDDEILDPEQNIRGGVFYLRMLVDRFDGDFDKTVAAYNAGPEAVIKAGGIPAIAETRDYVQKVKRLYFQYRVAEAMTPPTQTPVTAALQAPSAAR